LPSRTLVDVDGVLPSDDLVNGSDRAPRDQTDVVSKYPLQLLLVELLQRPIEFTQYLSMRYTHRLADAGIAPSVGSRGDSYDNALAESVIGLFKAEVIRRKGPWRSVEAVEFATLAWVDWFNHRRLLEPIGYVPPAEYEASYYAQLRAPDTIEDGVAAGILQPAPADDRSSWGIL
jgi:putative transposase